MEPRDSGLRDAEAGIDDGGRSRAGGFSLIEIMVSTAILIVGLTALGSAMMTAFRLDRLTGERKIALAFASSQIERIRGMTFAEMNARPRITNATPTADPPGAGGYLPDALWSNTTIGNNPDAGSIGFRQDLDGDGEVDYFGLNYYRQATTVSNLRVPVTRTTSTGAIVVVSDQRLDGLNPQPAPDPSVAGRVAQVLVRDSDATVGLVEGSGYYVTVRVFWRGATGQNEEMRMSTFIAR